MIHEEVFVKVNAKVDRGIAPLVAALNELPGIVTLESCEGDGNKIAYVSFLVGDEWQELGEFARRLSEALKKNEQLVDLWYSLSVEWYAGGKDPLGYLRVPRQHIPALATAISAISATKELRQVLVP